MCRKPHQGINFIIAHDGFTLYDLVAYNDKHNDANGEQNRDGSNDNFSWNCGQEGETDDAGVNALRQRQMRNMMLALMVSQGTPMVLMGELPACPAKQSELCTRLAFAEIRNESRHHQQQPCTACPCSCGQQRCAVATHECLCRLLSAGCIA